MKKGKFFVYSSSTIILTILRNEILCILNHLSIAILTILKKKISLLKIFATFQTASFFLKQSLIKTKLRWLTIWDSSKIPLTDIYVLYTGNGRLICGGTNDSFTNNSFTKIEKKKIIRKRKKERKKGEKRRQNRISGNIGEVH